jgi:hypothetical protein
MMTISTSFVKIYGVQLYTNNNTNTNTIVSYTPPHTMLPDLEGFPEITVFRVLRVTPNFSMPFI